jgi:signal transduction histidine kinase
MLRGNGIEAEVSDLSRPENRFEPSGRKLLEVYMPIQGPEGQPLLFEAYQRFGSVAASGRRLWLTFAPALIGGLLLLQLINLPLARSLARRLREGQRDKELLLERALDASQTERRAIAADLHDGVVQDLVGLSYALDAEAASVNAEDRRVTGLLRSGASQTRDAIRALRTLLVDIYPPSLHRAGLDAALTDLAKTYTARGLTTTVEGADAVRVGEEAERLLFRSAQELLRNTHAHAAAQHVRIRLAQEPDRATLELRDDGDGFDPVVLERRDREGHFGMRVLEDLVRDAGGRLTLDSAPGHGTRVSVEVPR